MEKYLQELHAEEYMGTDDDMPEAFDTWLVELQVEDWIENADRYADIKEMLVQARLLKGDYKNK